MRFKGSGLGLDSFFVCFAVGGFSSVVPEKQKSLNQGMYFNSCISRDPTVMYKLLCKVYIPQYMGIWGLYPTWVLRHWAYGPT